MCFYMDGFLFLHSDSLASIKFCTVEPKTNRLEKTSKIMKSNCQPNTTIPAKTYPEVPHLHVFWTPPGMVDSTTSLSSLFRCLTTHSVKKFFLTSTLNVPWRNLRPLPLLLLLVSWEKRPTPASLQPPFSTACTDSLPESSLRVLTFTWAEQRQKWK